MHARGQWVKDERPMHWQDAIFLPCFVSADSLEVTWLPTKLWQSPCMWALHVLVYIGCEQAKLGPLSTSDRAAAMRTQAAINANFIFALFEIARQ